MHFSIIINYFKLKCNRSSDRLGRTIP